VNAWRSRTNTRGKTHNAHSVRRRCRCPHSHDGGVDGCHEGWHGAWGALGAVAVVAAGTIVFMNQVRHDSKPAANAGLAEIAVERDAQSPAELVPNVPSASSSPNPDRILQSHDSPRSARDLLFRKRTRRHRRLRANGLTLREITPSVQSLFTRVGECYTSGRRTEGF
jgi:hypothetical protein